MQKKLNIIITGASSGIGAATAKILADRGHHIALIARNAEKLEALAGSLGKNIHVYPGDVNDAPRMKNIMDDVAVNQGGIDVLINNAGLGYFEAVADAPLSHWQETIQTNVIGLLNCLHPALPHLMKRHGHVINVGSVASHNVFPKSGIYCASKHAVFAISESLRLELADQIRVTTISPGAVNTAFVDTTTDPDLLAHYKKYFAGGMSAQTIAEQIAYAIEMPENTVISEIVIRPNRRQQS